MCDGHAARGSVSVFQAGGRMKEKLKSGDEIDCVWGRHILKIFERPGVAKKTKRRIHKRRRHENKLKIKVDA